MAQCSKDTCTYNGSNSITNARSFTVAILRIPKPYIKSNSITYCSAYFIAFSGTNIQSAQSDPRTHRYSNCCTIIQTNSRTFSETFKSHI